MNLEELTSFIRGTLPQPKAILYMKSLTEANAVTFVWNGRNFVVKSSLEVLEVKDQRVFITGASMLLQSALMGKNRNEKMLGAVAEDIGHVEELINNPITRERGLAQLSTVKRTLRKLSAP